MTSRELVRRTLEFAYPSQVAGIQRRFPDDIVASPTFYRVALPREGDPYAPGLYTDEWGCTFTNVQKGIIGVVKTPQLTDWSRLDRLRPPEERLSVDVEKVNRFCRDDERFVLAGCTPRPFERLQFIRGTENLLMDLARQPPELASLIQRIHAFYLKELEIWAGTEVDALVIVDDWGAQDAMLVSPALWRSLFRPLYQEYIEIAHGRGKFVFMHSDGYILDILPDLIDLRLDAINCQVACMGAPVLGERFRGKITFWGELDRQRLLVSGTQQDVVTAVLEMTEALYHDGGLIAQCEFGLNARPDNVYAAFEAWENVKT